MSKPVYFTFAAIAASLCTVLPAQTPTATDAAALRKAIRSAWGADWSAASTAARKLVEVAPQDAVGWYQLGYALHAQKKYAEALTAHLRAAAFENTAVRIPSTYNVACVYSIQHKSDDAFTWLDKAIERGFRDLATLEQDEDMAHVRNDPRFAKVIERVKKAQADNPFTAYAQSVPRMRTRVAYFSRTASGGQVSVDYSPVPWRDAYDAALAEGKFTGQRWRLGSDFWTTLDNSLPVELAGQQIAPGCYYLTLSHDADKKFTLHVLPAAAVRAQRLDGFQAAKTTGGTSVPLKHESGQGPAKQLAIELSVGQGAANRTGTLSIRFGPHRLTAPLVVSFPPAKRD